MHIILAVVGITLGVGAVVVAGALLFVIRGEFLNRKAIDELIDAPATSRADLVRGTAIATALMAIGVLVGLVSFSVLRG